MIPIPAIDLKGGKVVRLAQGDFKEEKVYETDAAAVARVFEEEGAQRIHVVDLDGALGGRPQNARQVERILEAVPVPVELGGGVRDVQTALDFLEMGVSWVIFGTKACLDAGFVKEAAAELKEKMIVGLDARDGLVATDGWTKMTKIKALDLALSCEKAGVQTLIYTDISTDGMLTGPNVEAVKELSESVAADIIASGGVSSLADVKKLALLARPNLIGVIIGKALYENKISLRDAVKTCLPNG